MAVTLTPTDEHSSRQHRTEQIQAQTYFSRHERKATLERVSLTRNEKDAPLTLLVGSGTPGAGCRGTSEKQVGTWFAQGKDQSPDERRRTEKQQHVEFLIAGNKKQFIFKTWRNNKLQQEKVFAPTCVLMAPASRSGKFGRRGELHPLM